MSDMTRIIDLPENVTIQMNTTGNRGDGVNTSYTPMDIHPNPYGHPKPSVPAIPMPSANGMQQSVPFVQQTLPSRDIPMNQTNLTQDAQVHANYIPPISEIAKQTAEYMKKYDEITEKKVELHIKEKERKTRLDYLYDEYQIPILISVLFFIFQMPVINNIFHKYLIFLKLHDLDGHFNIYGLLLKSVLFGTSFYSITRVIQNLSEF